MATNSGTLTLAQKKRLWQQTKYDEFQQNSKDKSLMFNYFMINNDIFKMISPEDQFKFKQIQMKCDRQRAFAFLGSFLTVLVADKVLLPAVAPRFRINRFRFFVNFFKYVMIPGGMALIYKLYFMQSYQYFFYNMQEKYAFGFQDYMKANRIYQRALAVDRLQQLFEKRDEFDWTGIPQLPQQPAIKQQTKK